MGEMLGNRVLRTIALVALLLAAASLLPNAARTEGPTEDDFERACEEGNPFLVTSSFRGVGRGGVMGPYATGAPSVMMISDTPNNQPQYTLATIEQVGSVWGLAYRSADNSIYAAAYHKVQLPFGPGGPGAIYRIDLRSGDVHHVLTVPGAGPDRHESPIRSDLGAEPWVGRTSLGDIDLSTDETTLFVANLADRRIYRYALPSGRLIGSFDHGASAELWRESARPFALAATGGHLYHGVVNSAEESIKPEDLAAHVYQSRADGSEMTAALSVSLDFRRGRIDGGARNVLDWQPWRDGFRSRSELTGLTMYPMPILTDLVMHASGELDLGFRDRRSDSLPHYQAVLIRLNPRIVLGYGVGDIIRASNESGSWAVDVTDEHYDDAAPRFGDEVALGGLALLPGDGMVVVGAYVTNRGATSEGAYWFDTMTGDRRQHERIDAYHSAPLASELSLIDTVYADNEGPGIRELRAPGTVGDVEVLCAPVVDPTATPTPTATAAPTDPPTPTAPPPTASQTPTPRATQPPTPTPTRVPAPIYLPIALKERCDPDRSRADVALVIDTSSSMAGRKIDDAKGAALEFVRVMDLTPERDQVAIVRFDAESEVVQELTHDRQLVEAAIGGLHERQGTHIDKGLRDALAELRSERREPTNTAVAVLLTDGIHNGEPGADLAAAREVRAGGIRLYVVGLGADVDGGALEEMAGDPRRYYFAPDSGDLAGIYGEIAFDIACPPDKLWPYTSVRP